MLVSFWTVCRSLDLTLDALESDPSNRGLLRLVDNFNKDSVPNVVGFKLRHYRDSFVAKVHRARAREAFKRKVGRVAYYIKGTVFLKRTETIVCICGRQNLLKL